MSAAELLAFCIAYLVVIWNTEPLALRRKRR